MFIRRITKDRYSRTVAELFIDDSILTNYG